jgi:hypothetical protein
MYTPDAGRTHAPTYEPSPSTGWRETAAIMHAPDAHTVEEIGDLEDTTMFRESSITLEVAQ